MTHDQEKRIYDHGRQLQELFKIPGDPVRLCKRLRRLETKAHRYAELDCNGLNTPDGWQEQILTKVKGILGESVPGLFVNSDPRGYALKLDWRSVEASGIRLPQDWGGYGIIAPDLTDEVTP